MNRLRRRFDVHAGGRSDWDRKGTLTLVNFQLPTPNSQLPTPKERKFRYSLTVKVGVGAVKPVLTDRAEKIQLEGVVERLSLMRDP